MSALVAAEAVALCPPRGSLTAASTASTSPLRTKGLRVCSASK